MNKSPAPFFNDIAEGPEQVSAWWLTTSDGLRIRVAYWPCDAAKGTVLMLPGRTEYVEKYGVVAKEFAARGFAMMAIDWRGQGLADRLIDDARVGHIIDFPDYQKDLAVALDLIRDLGAPAPWHLIGHSMGGGIGLRAVMAGIPVKTCAFTGPMWGIYMAPLVKPFGWALPRVADAIGMGTKLPPSTSYENYVLSNPFQGNMLTTDPDMYALMHRQLTAQPDLALGGPSLIWLREALRECRYLSRQPSPNLPCVTFLGENEQIIDCPRVHDRMNRWPGGALDVLPGAEHEVLMETPALRSRVYDRMEALFTHGETGVSEPLSA